MLGSYVGGILIFSDVHYTPDQLQALTPEAFAAFRASELDAVKLPYILIAGMVLAWAALVACAKFPPVDRGGNTEGGFAGLKTFPHYWLGVLAQFAYVGAQVGVWSFPHSLHPAQFPGHAGKDALRWLPISSAYSSPAGSSARCSCRA
jgi:FHS family L-fucose permease-like MFS transporter